MINTLFHGRGMWTRKDSLKIRITYANEPRRVNIKE